MKKIYLAALAATAALAAVPAQAVTFVAVNGSAVSYGLSEPGAQFTFEAGTPAGFTQTLTGGAFVSSAASAPNGARPAFDTSTNYLSVVSGGTATLAAAANSPVYKVVSLYAGSLDALNSLQFFGAGGALLKTYSGVDLAAAPPGATGDQGQPQTNRFLTFFAEGNEVFTSIKLSSGIDSFEADNVRFAAAVPEPATWLMLLFGFGGIGLTMRSRRRSTNVVYA